MTTSFDEFYKRFPELAEDILVTICDGESAGNVIIEDVEHLNAVDRMIYGTVLTPEGLRYFEVEDGISRGTVVRQWTTPEKARPTSVEGPARYMLVPDCMEQDETVLKMGTKEHKRIVLMYRKRLRDPQFQQLVRNYNYDLYQAPGNTRIRNLWGRRLKTLKLKAVRWEEGLRWAGKVRGF